MMSDLLKHEPTNAPHIYKMQWMNYRWRLFYVLMLTPPAVNSGRSINIITIFMEDEF
jgi:hypothetical protein